MATNSGRTIRKRNAGVVRESKSFSGNTRPINSNLGLTNESNLGNLYLDGYLDLFSLPVEMLYKRKDELVRKGIGIGRILVKRNKPKD